MNNIHHKKNISKSVLLVVLISIAVLFPTHARSQESLNGISNENFVIASLVVAEPGNAMYSILGHCAIRMECPSEKLDYCFTLESDTSTGNILNFFSGKAIAGVFAVPSSSYIEAFQNEGRGVKQYKLNLNIKEKQLLWKNLDEEIVKPPHLRFDFLNTNCIMMSVFMIEHSLINESLDYSAVPDYMKALNGERIRHHSKHAPWSQFIYITLCGAAADQKYDIEYTLSPTCVDEVLSQATIISADGTSRPLLSDHEQTVVSSQHLYKASSLTPRIIFSLLLIIIIIITIGEWRWKWRIIPKCVDTFLLIGQTLAGILLLYFTIGANLFGVRWNWYLIPLMPLPLFIWLVFHKKKTFHKVYLIYAIILVLFIAATPLSSQLDIDHQLITASMLIRCISRFLKRKTSFNENTEK